MARIIDPDLIAAIVRQLNVRGELAPFDISQVAVPVFDIGKLTALDTIQAVGTRSDQTFVPGAPPALNDGNALSDVVNNPAAGASIFDSGQLAAGIIWLTFSATTDVTGTLLELQWRNAANAATLASWNFLMEPGQTVSIGPFSPSLLLNERFRVVNVNVLVGNVALNMTVQPQIHSLAS